MSAKTDQEIIWGMTKESVLIFCRLFPEQRGEAALELIKAHKRLFPERHTTPTQEVKE